MATRKHESLLFEKWPRLAYRRARLVLLGAALSVIGLGVLFGFAAGSYSDEFTIPNAESQRLFDLLEERFPARAGDTATVVVKAEESVAAEESQNRLSVLLEDLDELPHVIGVSDPRETGFDISQDGKTARIEVQYDQRANDLDLRDEQALLDLLKASRAEGFQAEAGGRVVEQFEDEPPGSSEAIGIGAAIVILLLAFGSLVAMGLPIITALVGLTSGFFLVSVGAQFVPMPNFTAQFAAMIGIGVGIDYALLVVNRFREAAATGYTNEESTLIAAATAGRSVFFAGGTVVIALLGLWASGIESIGWVGTAGALIVGLMVIAAVGVLPAVLRYAGPYVDRWRIPLLAAPAGDLHQGMGYRLSRIVQSRPLLCLVLAGGLMLLLTAPVLDLRTGTSDSGNNPSSFTSRRAYDLLSEGFGAGTNGPILVGLIVDNPDDSTLAKIEGLPEVLRAEEGVQQVSPVQFNETRSAAVVQVIPDSAPQDQGTVDLINLLRRDLRAEFNGSGAEPLVGGSTALFIDVGNHVTNRLPIFLGAVIALSFVLLMAVFRSVLVPLKAALMNLLSIGASFGVLVAIFQWGWLGDVFGVSREGPIESFLPMMLFSVLFGLSMDYEVFLVSRIREEYVATGDNTESVARGLSATTRVITAAAAIMICVFAAFGLSDQRVVKEFGIGLATAIFLDATVVRLVLVPSLMQLAGDWNWWMPKWLDRILPRLHFDGHAFDDPSVPYAAGRKRAKPEAREAAQPPGFN